MNGIIRTRVGYCGGEKKHPSYTSIGDHTEGISLDYDPQIISYDDLLRYFWGNHDSRSKSYNTQYLRAIFARSSEQRALAEASLERHAEENGIATTKMHTPIIDIDQFTLAEQYHQKYRLAPGGEVRTFLEATYPDLKAFTDSTVATRLNAFAGTQVGEAVWSAFMAELPEYGLAPALEEAIRNRSLI